MNKFSKMKINWRSYNHCLYVLYLASVALRYGLGLDYPDNG